MRMSCFYRVAALIKMAERCAEHVRNEADNATRVVTQAHFKELIWAVDVIG